MAKAVTQNLMMKQKDRAEQELAGVSMGVVITPKNYDLRERKLPRRLNHEESISS
jgi:hypothetical protein